MLIRDILQRKGGEVLLVARDATVTDAVAAMCEKGVGSALVAGPSGPPEGILTERDVLKLFAKHGERLGALTVADVMTSPVQTVGPETTVQTVLQLMTRHRFRRMPVMEGDALAGIVSIGDLVKARLEETELEAESLKQYIATSY